MYECNVANVALTGCNVASVAIVAIVAIVALFILIDTYSSLMGTYSSLLKILKTKQQRLMINGCMQMFRSLVPNRK